MSRKKFEVGGVVGFSSVYVDRKEDETLESWLKQDNETVLILGPRMIGKTSLAQKALNRIKQKGCAINHIYLNLHDNRPPTEEPKKGTWWFSSILVAIGLELGQDSQSIKAWINNELSTKGFSYTQLFYSFLKNYCSNNKGRTIITIDELDELQQHGSYTDELFRALVKLYNDRDSLRLSFILVGNLPISFLMKSDRLSSFKIGRPLRLSDFELSKETIADWSSYLPVACKNKTKITKYTLEQTGGNAFLMSKIFREVHEKSISTHLELEALIEEIIQKGRRPTEGEEHFRAPKDFILESLVSHQALRTYDDIYSGKIDSITSNQEEVLGTLLSSGLIRLLPNNKVELRSPIYSNVFNKDWIKVLYKNLASKSKNENKTKPYPDKQYSRICVINMGGTLGMISRNEKMVAPVNNLEFKEVYPFLNTIDFLDYIPLSPKDGANVNSDDWAILSKTIYDQREAGFDGFVVIHGTDTLQYTASATSFALGDGLNFPVVFVGSQAPHTAFHADAEVNLRRAIRVALEDIPEVVICFGDKVFRAVRATKSNDFDFRGFTSPLFEPLAIIRERIEINKKALRQPKEKSITNEANFESNVLQLTQHPDLRPMLFFDLLKKNNFKGLLIESLGVGNLTTLDTTRSWIPFVDKTVNELNIPVIITSKYPIIPQTIKQYIPAMEPISVGAIHAGNMVSSTALTKLMWLLPQLPESSWEEKIKIIEKQIKHSYVGEVDKF